MNAASSTTSAPRPLVTRVRRLADEVLAPRAELVDQEGVPASNIEAVKRSGLLGVERAGGVRRLAGARGGGP